MSENRTAQVLNVKPIEKNKVLLEVQVAPERVARSIETVYRKIVKSVNIPGFRPGKAPRHIVENRVGKENFMAEVQNDLLTPAFIEALNETNIKPLNSELKEVTLEEGKPMVFKIEVEKEPIFDVKDYQGIPLKGAPIEASDGDIDEKIGELRERNARLDPVTDRPSQQGDFAIIDYQGYIGGEISDGIKGTNQMFEIGAKRAIAGFEEGLVGMKIGDRKDLFLRFPDDYHSKDYAGKEVRFDVTLKELKNKVLPEVNDDFAKQLGEVNTINELREDIKNRIIESRNDHQKHHFREQIADYLIEKNPQVDSPEPMVEKELDRIIKNYEIEFLMRRLDLNHYLQSMGMTQQQFRERHRGAAVKGVKMSNILSSIAEHERIQATDEEVKTKIEKFAQSIGKPFSVVKKQVEEEGNLVYMREEIVHQKVYDMLIGKASLTLDPNYKCEHEKHHDHDHEHDHDHGHEHND